MANILAFTLPVPGHVFPFLPILAELRARGHDVTIAICSSGPVPTSMAGIPVLAVRWQGSGERLDSPTRYAFQRFSTPDYFAAYGESLAQGLEAAITQSSAAFLLVDPKLWGGLVAAEASELPWASVAHNPLYFRAVGVDPRGPGFAPPRRRFGRMLHRLLDMAIRVETAGHLSHVNAVRTRRALTPLARLTDLFASPPLILATTSQPFEYPRSDWPSGLAFIGPILADPAATDVTAHFVEDERPTILVSGSTIAATGGAAGWADTVLDALASEPFRVLTTLPTERVRGRAASIGGELISHSALLPHVSCVVCHGGAGIVHKALWFGVPVVAIPFAIDRFEVARRVEVAGAGVMLPIDRLNGASLRASVRRALRCREGAARVSRQFRAAGGPRLAADLIEARMR